MSRIVSVMTALAFCAGCAGPSEDEPPTPAISGTVIYLERIALPPGAEVTVELQEVSPADAAARVIASTRFGAMGAPPYPFELSYDPAAVDEHSRYTLRAGISQGETLLFTTDTVYPAFDGQTHELRVRSVAQETDDTPPARGLAGRDWLLMSLDGEAVAPLEDGRRPHLHFEAGGRMHGFAGCNRIMGGYQLTDGQLGFSRIAMTRMACAEGMEIEQRFADALDRVASYALDGDTLGLLDAEGRTLAVLEAAA